MGIWSTILGGGAAKVVDSVGGVLDNLFTSDEEREEAKRLMEQVKDKPHQDQRNINLVEAAHRSVFVAGWRPFLGWVGGLSLASYYLPKHFMAAGLWMWQNVEYMRQAIKTGDITSLTLTAYPISLDDTIMALISGLLGLAVTRTYEKKKGLTR
ncbi:3TM-type holin [uncultured Pseudodesulfovibrio sp.]|uniref:3TM-type holin n=1 Tax=uncultured Pseudodesulfovibrio sp. TaxID=2035858 RepID=UPI0029C8F1BB|nr:3TM-type holin [uncultured Pseudodesulfovibrio sp.]